MADTVHPAPPAWARLAVLSFSALVLVVDALRLFHFADPEDGAAAGAGAVLIALLLPVHLRHIRAGMRGERPVGVGWTLALVVVINAVGLVVVGPAWVLTLSTIVSSALILLPLRWSLGALVGCVLVAVAVTAAAAAAPWGVLLEGGHAALWFVAYSVTNRSVQQFAVVWALAAAAGLAAERAEQARTYRVRERARLTDAVSTALVPRLDELATLADRARTASEPGRIGAVTAAADAALARLRETVTWARRGSGAATTADPDPAGAPGRPAPVAGYARDHGVRVAAVVLHVVVLAFPLAGMVLQGESDPAGPLLWALTVAAYLVLVLPAARSTTLEPPGRSVRVVLAGAAVLAGPALAQVAVGGVSHTLWWLPAAAAIVVAPRPVREIVVGACTLAMTAFGLAISELPLLVAVLYLVVISLATAGALAVSVILVGTVDSLARDRLSDADRAADGERLRVSARLHDLLGQTLTAISLKADLAVRLLDVDPARARSEIAEVAGLAHTQRAELGEALSGSAPRTLYAEVVRARSLLTTAGIRVTVDLDPDEPPGDRPADDPAADLAAWTVREATTNILRHADARHVSITRRGRGTDVVLVIDNDGAPPRRPSDGGTGLSGLALRAQHQRGHLDAAHVPPDGYRVELTLPAEVTT